LRHLTVVGEVSHAQFQKQFLSLGQNVRIYVGVAEGRVVACGTLLVEPKFIHKCRPVGHIEDIVVSGAYRKKGYGGQIVRLLVEEAKSADCYKCILDCDEHKVIFYEKQGFASKSIQMALYL
jgi:glucosamine-phosphate N-acetyltransferase